MHLHTYVHILHIQSFWIQLLEIVQQNIPNDNTEFIIIKLHLVFHKLSLHRKNKIKY